MESHDAHCFPKSFRMLACKLEDWGRNTFRLQTQGADTGRAGSIITLNLPENACLHLPSLRMFLNFVGATSGVVGSGNEVFAKLGNDHCLISRVELFCNGVQINNPFNEYSTGHRITQISRSTIPRDQSIDRCLGQSYINNNDSPDVTTLCYGNWLGFLGEASAEWISTELLGSLQVRITLAGNEVLVAKQAGVPITTQITNATAVANAQALSYTVNNIYFTIASGVPPVAYNMLLREMLEMNQEIAINYRNYYSYTLDNINSGSATIRWSLSSGSIDKVYSTVRDASYLTVGAPAWSLPDYLGAQYVSNNCRFRAFNNGGLADVKLFKTLNNVQYPQYQMGVLEALANSSYVSGKMPNGHEGNLITSQGSFWDGLFQDDLILNVNSELGVSLKSGYNSRGVNTFMTATQNGMVIPTPVVGALSPNTGSLSMFVLVETTATLIVGLGKAVSVSY